MLDPVRFISNLSTGEMGYAIAKVAHARRHPVTLISGPTALQRPPGIKFVPIVTASELKKACGRAFARHDVLIMVAAVCDFTAAKMQKHKIRRIKTKQIRLQRTPDIIAELAKRKGKRRVIGFCLETRDWLGNARKKLAQKNLDGIVASYYGKGAVPFGAGRMTAAFVDPKGGVYKVKNKPKRQVARALLDWIEAL